MQSPIIHLSLICLHLLLVSVPLHLGKLCVAQTSVTVHWPTLQHRSRGLILLSNPDRLIACGVGVQAIVVLLSQKLPQTILGKTGPEAG